MIEYPNARRKQSASPYPSQTLYFMILPGDDYSYRSSSHVTTHISYNAFRQMAAWKDRRVHFVLRRYFPRVGRGTQIRKLVMIGQRGPIRDLYTWRIRQQNASIWWISWLEIFADRMKFHGKIAMILREWALLLLFCSGTVNGAP